MCPGIREPSPAGGFGSRSGDRITEVDGKPASSYTLASLQKLLFDDAVPCIKLSIQEPLGEKNLTIGKKCLFN